MVTTIILFMVLWVGSILPMSDEEAESLMEEAEKFLKDLTIIDIFLNNFGASLLSYIPFIGMFLMGAIIFHTGRFIGALSAQLGIDSMILILSTIIMIYGLVEFLGYGVAVSEGVILSYSIMKKRLRTEVRWLLISIGITALLLAFAAVVEWLLIKMFEELAIATI